MTPTTPFDSNDHNFGGDAASDHDDRSVGIDYLKAEARRLPSGTAAKVLATLTELKIQRNSKATTNGKKTYLIDIGEYCIDCLESVAWGSGRFINRIPASNEIHDGWMCPECQHDPDTDECNCDNCYVDSWDDNTGES